MEKPTLHKKLPLIDVKKRKTQSLTEEETSMVNETINKFFELFTDKHLG